MILAAPLVIPFAEAVGISIATLGMAKVADMVNDYIQENPEQSMKILSTIVPGVGIGEIFMKKGKDEEVEEEVEVEDVDARDLTRAEKAKMMKELAKSGGGNMREKMKKGYEEIIQPGESDRELDDAEDRYDGGLEEVSKPKFDYKKFFKKRYADGGAIGIEVLFEEKKPRQGLFMGGPALTGQPLAIYNSMSAYNSFTDQEIADAIKEAGYELPTADSGTTPPGSTPGQTIGFQGGNDGSIGGAPSSLVSGFKTQTQDRQNRLTNPNKVQSFINNFTGGGQADIGEMIRTGQIDTRKTSGIPLGVGAAFAKMMPDKYYDMSLGDQVFTQSQMGYTGPTVFGENTSGLNKDPFGLNTRSAFGNYAEAVGSDFASLSESLSGRLADKYGVEFDEETGMFTGKNAELANKMTNMMRTKFNFRKDQLAAKNRLDSQIKAAERQRQEAKRIQDELAAAAAAKSKVAALAAIKKQGQASYNPNIHGPTNYGQDSQGNQSFDSGQGFGIGSDGGPVSNRTGRGRTGYSEGGLVTMFKEKR